MFPVLSTKGKKMATDVTIRRNLEHAAVNLAQAIAFLQVASKHCYHVELNEQMNDIEADLLAAKDDLNRLIDSPF